MGIKSGLLIYGNENEIENERVYDIVNTVGDILIMIKTKKEKD